MELLRLVNVEVSGREAQQRRNEGFPVLLPHLLSVLQRHAQGHLLRELLLLALRIGDERTYNYSLTDELIFSDRPGEESTAQAPLPFLWN